MVKSNLKRHAARIALLITALLSACGGGGELAPCGSAIAKVNQMLDAGLCGSASSRVTGGLAVQAASLRLALSDASGAPATSVSPDSAGVLQATVADASGKKATGVAVTFSTTDKTGAFLPATGTALTDADGIARVGLSAGSQAGAFTVAANASVAGQAAAGTVGYAVVLPTLTLSPLSIAPATLSAGGNASVSVTVLSGAAAYTAPLSVTFTSPCASAGKALLGSPVLTQNGVANASYSDKGCGVPDPITAAVTLGGATVNKSGTVTVLPASAGSIKFVSADTTNIALKGTGGFGRQEYSTLKFEVSDTTGNKVAGKLVDFVFADSPTTTTVGGLGLNPSSATSAADGSVTTLVSGGNIPTSVRVVATVHASTPPISSLSNILVISTGVPDQKHFSLATETGNCEGWDFEQTCSVITATLGDHFGNPAPDGTAVNFSTEGGIIDASCVTGSLPATGATPSGQSTNSKVGPGSGTCSVTLRASSPRPPGGRLTVLAYAVGEESLVDANGNNVFDAGDSFSDKSPDLFRDDNENGLWTPGEPCIGPNSNGACSTPGDGQYNGVLRVPALPAAQTLRVSEQLVQTLSGSFAKVSFSPASLTCPVGGTADVQVSVADQNGNLMPAGTVIKFSSFFGFGLPELGVFPSSVTVPNVPLKVGQALVLPTYTVSVACLASGGKFFVTVSTPKKIETVVSIPIN